MEKKDLIAPVGGVVILAGGLALAFFTATNGALLQENRDKIIKRYILQAQNLISKGELKEAKKIVKKALVVDPKNKEVLNELEKIILANCQNSSLPLPSSTKKPQTKPEAEEDDEMGCI